MRERIFPGKFVLAGYDNALKLGGKTRMVTAAGFASVGSTTIAMFVAALGMFVF
ncbi:MAG: hypothetical protein M3Z22_02870 [Verrucomicrobiota bacterium]|nr:hypothetical protein [Verrucomicrobiota bacterium]